MSRQVRDPEREEVWQTIDAHNDREAVQAFLSSNEYDTRDFDTGMPFVLHVRTGDDDEPRKVKVRVVPARFEVA